MEEAEKRPHPSGQGEGSAAIPLWEFCAASRLVRTALGLEEALPPLRPRDLVIASMSSRFSIMGGILFPRLKGLTWYLGVALQGSEQV